MSQQIVQTKCHCQVHLQGTEIPILMPDIVIDLHLTMTIETDIDLTGQDLHLTMIIETDIDLTGQDPTPTSHRYRSHSQSNS